MFQYNCFCLGIAVIDDSLNFSVYLAGNSLTVSLCMSKVTSDEHFIIIVIISDNTDIVRHSETGNHSPGYLRSALNITGCPGGNILKNNFLGNSSTQ